jgi:hypothetical protein
MESAATTPAERIIREQAVKFLHDDFDSRYVLDHIRTELGADFESLLRDISQNDIQLLKDFFFSTIYPKMDARQRRDKSFESMVAMLKQPAKLGRIIPSMPSIVFRYATIWPTALNVGLNAMMAYLLSMRIEAQFTHEILQALEQRGVCVNEQYTLARKTYEDAYRKVPYNMGRRMLNASMKVMRAGKQPRLVNAAANILKDVESALRRVDQQRRATGQPEIYVDPLSAMDFGKSVLDEVRTIFGSLGQEKMSRIILITQALELRHLDMIHGKDQPPQ